MSKGKSTKNTRKRSGQPPDDPLLEHLRSTEENSRYESGWRAKLNQLLGKIHRRGLQKLTIMVIPHTEKKIINLHVNLYSVTLGMFALFWIVVISIISLVGKSGESIEFYDMGLTNSQFNIQSTKIAEEIIPLHELINNYSNTIAELYLKMDGDQEDLSGQGGDAQAVLDNEVQDLQSLIQQCRELGDECDQKLTDDILRRVIYLSSQDNQSLNRAVDLSEKILSELKTREKQNLLKNTPSIWPVRGYIISPFGWKIDPVRGQKVFMQGIEIGATQGSEVVAAAPGTISDVGYDDQYGLYLWINHRFGIKTFYAHLDRITISAGDRVAKGDVIGFVGKSGNIPVSMLYYEVHVGTVAYNPHAFLNHLQDQWLIKPNH